jgi:hypothetical protein
MAAGGFRVQVDDGVDEAPLSFIDLYGVVSGQWSAASCQSLNASSICMENENPYAFWTLNRCRGNVYHLVISASQTNT